MTVHRHADIFSELVKFEMQWDTQRSRPFPLDNLSVEVDPDQLRWTEFIPRDEPWVAEQGAIAKIHRDVAGQMVGVALSPQRSR
jgi:hypothetical protein